MLHRLGAGTADKAAATQVYSVRKIFPSITLSKVFLFYWSKQLSLMRLRVLKLAVIGFGTCLAIVSSDMPAPFSWVLHRPRPVVNCCLIFLTSFQVVSSIVLGLLICGRLLAN